MGLPLVLAQVSSEVATMGENSRRRLKKAAEKVLIFLSLMALMMVPGSSQTMPAAGPQTTRAPKATATTGPKRVVLVSIPDRKLALITDGRVVKIYDTAVGADRTPTPTGTFKIARRVTNPTWYHAGRVVRPGKQNPVGTRWLGLNTKGYGIHGTNAPQSIGKNASHGCIRMRNRDIEELFDMVAVGDVVELRGEADPEVLKVFHPAPVIAEVLASGGQ